MFIENEYTEFKRELTKNIKKEIVAFANSKGGSIYIGVNDNGVITGLKDASSDAESLSGMIREGIKSDLTIYTTININENNGKYYIELKIMSAPNKPYYLADKGLKPSGVFIRHGNASVPASDELIKKMIKENHDAFETEISSNQDLHFDYVTKVFESKNIPFNKSKYKNLNLVTEYNYFNNLALLISDECPYSIKCAIFEGNNKITFKDRKEFTGSIFKQLEDALNYLKLVNRISGKIVDFQRVDTYDYPEYALREAILNALIHRNYNFSGSILISVFDNRCEITSLGGLVLGISIEDILSGVSESRNQNLANIFYRLEYVESYGTGIGRMIDTYKEFHKRPKFEITDNVFKVILPNVNYKEENVIKNIDYMSQKERIIAYLKEHKTIKREEIEVLLNIEKSRSKEIILEMIKEGIIQKCGSGRSTYYELK